MLAPTPAWADPGDLSAYVKARAADADGAVDLAAANYARALAAAPSNPGIAIRAYREALEAGDVALATRAATALDTAGVAPSDAALLPLAVAARRGDAKAADAAIARLATGPLAVLVPALTGWTVFVRGGDPAAALGAAPKDLVATRFATETRALLLIARGRYDAGIAALSPDLRMPNDLRVAAAQLLFGQRQDAAARTLLDGRDPTFVALREGAPAKPTLGFGVSRLLVRVASDLAGGTPTPLSIALTQAALTADPSCDRARILLADALGKGGAVARALAVLDGVDPDSPFAGAAAAERVVVLTTAGRDADALAVAAARADRAEADAYDWQRYADLLVNSDRAADAVPYYRRVIDTGEQGDGWAAWLQYGGALDQAGRWPEAREALAKAVARGPNEPIALNYLGFARVEHGEDVAGSTRLLAHAATLDPDNASITDSLGWAYHLGGNTVRALPLLERAAIAEPTNTEIGEHLGDAYWTLGRRYEARYAWRAAQVTATGDGVTRLATKIADGLPTGVRR
ncbi:tetratricopeptide repeat protein [Sphingomonas ginsenosidivorax]|uniref:Tetratricopeptide repeat protein n=1 Tax=Sphingomonas ginsenosidivorax TaxID=862135 RepID=A0A5C6UJ18_9SPHN|nr:tetratricopeptide repeat protein [Sphingomonas ginsenosidivorax]